MKTALFLIMCGITVMGCDRKSDDAQKDNPPASPASGATATDAPAVHKPDNTAVNTRDRTPDAITAGAQSQGKSDVDITADVRRRIMGGKMSISAQNVKIITESGKITLRGPVNTEEEKDTIGRFANEVAQPANVDNQLEVKP